jgi:hypothetical protein
MRHSLIAFRGSSIIHYIEGIRGHMSGIHGTEAIMVDRLAPRFGGSTLLPRHSAPPAASSQRRLPIHDRLNDIRREQRQPLDVGRVDLLGRRKFVEHIVARVYASVHNQ